MINKNIEISDYGLIIEPEKLEDAEDIHKYMGCDPEITRFTGWNPYQTLESTIEKIKRDLSAADDAEYSWIIKKNKEFIGTIGAYDYNADDCSIEIGYSIARHFWGNGYAKASTKAIVSFLLGKPHIKSIRAWSHKDNKASRAVLLSAGFEESGVDGENIIFTRK